MKFSKLQATGNDFILVDARRLEQDWPSLASSMCQYHFGVGADGLILVQESTVADLKMRVFNPDGSEAEACGNGLRCFARYVIEKGIVSCRMATGSYELKVETLSGIRKAKAYISGVEVGRVEVSMGIPQFQPEQIPIRAGAASITPVIVTGANKSPLISCQLTVDGYQLAVFPLSLGNPHAVSFMSGPVASFPLAEIGPKVESHPFFPRRTNFEIASILSRNEIEARVWERGVGETLACGSGACAIAVAAQMLDYVDRQVDIMFEGGTLTIYWDGAGDVLLAGPVEAVFEGEWPRQEGKE